MEVFLINFNVCDSFIILQTVFRDGSLEFYTLITLLMDGEINYIDNVIRINQV